MPNCKLTWGSSASHSLTLEVGRRGLVTNYKQQSYQNKAASGKIETINLHGYTEMTTDVYITADKYRDVVAFWSWARQGKTFAFARSASNEGSTTLASSLAASGTIVSVNSTSSLAASDTVLIRSASSDDTFELAKISAISTSTITLTAGVKYAYSSGAVLRHYDYWGECILLDKTFDPVQGDHSIYTHTLKFTEAL